MADRTKITWWLAFFLRNTFWFHDFTNWKPPKVGDECYKYSFFTQILVIMNDYDTWFMEVTKFQKVENDLLVC